MLRRNSTHNDEAFCNAYKAESAKPFEIKKLCRYRKNVLDLLNLFGKKALTCYILFDVDMSEVERLRKEMDREHHHVTVTSFLLKAIALAQKDFPSSRTVFLPDARLATLKNIVAGFTVERKIKGEPAVFFGEIEDPQAKTIMELNTRLAEYGNADIMQVPKLKEQKLFAELPCLARRIILFLGSWFPALRLKCQAATFGLSSLGALGINVAFGPSVCTSVFGVGAVEAKPVVRNEQVVIRPILTMSLCFDQRAMNGPEAERFAARIRDLLQGEMPDLQQPETIQLLKT